MFSLADYEAVATAYLRGLEANSKPGRGRFGRLFLCQPRRYQGRCGARSHWITPRPSPCAARRRLPTPSSPTVVSESFLGLRPLRRCRHAGAMVQRPLWASTSTKNPDYRDVIYVEELIGQDTVNTLPVATLEGFRDHGEPRTSLLEDVAGADRVFAELAEVGVDIDAITAELQVEGVAAFAKSFDQLLGALDGARVRLIESGVEV